MRLNETIRVVSREPGADQREQHGLAEDETVRGVEVAAHPLRIDDEPVGEPGEAVEHVVEREERVGQDHALGARVGDIAFVPQRDVLERDEGVRAHDAGEPAETLGDDRVALVGHRGRALLATPEGLHHLADLRPGQMADLGREALDRRGEDGERAEQLGMAVSRDHLRRRRLTLEPEPLADEALDVGVAAAVDADRSGQLPDPQPLEGAGQPLPVARRARTPSLRAWRRTSSPRRGRRACARPWPFRGAPRPCG